MVSELEICRLQDNISIIKRQLAQKQHNISELNKEVKINPSRKQLTEAANERIEE